MTDKRTQHCGSWLEGVEQEWPRIQSIFGGILTASEQGDQETVSRLRRRLLRAVRLMLQRAHFKGRLLGMLGNVMLRADCQLRMLQKSYDVSKREGDGYSQLLSAYSLAEFFVEERCDIDHARYWIERARPLLGCFRRSGLQRDLKNLEKRIAELTAKGLSMPGKSTLRKPRSPSTTCRKGPGKRPYPMGPV